MPPTEGSAYTHGMSAFSAGQPAPTAVSRRTGCKHAKVSSGQRGTLGSSGHGVAQSLQRGLEFAQSRRSTQGLQPEHDDVRMTGLPVLKSQAHGEKPPVGAQPRDAGPRKEVLASGARQPDVLAVRREPRERPTGVEVAEPHSTRPAERLAHRVVFHRGLPVPVSLGPSCGRGTLYAMGNAGVDLERQLADALDALASAQVPYALCGGMALAVHGIPRATEDIDLLVPQQSLDSALAALNSAGFTLRAGPLPLAIASGTPQQLYRVTRPLGTAHVTVDILVSSPEYVSAWDGRMCVDWNGRPLWVVSRKGLVDMKRLSRRMKDLADLERLAEDDVAPP